MMLIFSPFGVGQKKTSMGFFTVFELRPPAMECPEIKVRRLQDMQARAAP
jgi:hypothetical protein